MIGTARWHPESGALGGERCNYKARGRAMQEASEQRRFHELRLTEEAGHVWMARLQ